MPSNSQKLGEDLLKMKDAGTLPSKEELLNNFQKGDHLPMLLDYFLKVATLFEMLFDISKKWDDLETHPFESVIFSHLTRFKRYTLGLTRLSFRHGLGIIHCIDCYYPILKSIFELSAENRLAAAYVHNFGRTPENKKQVADKILAYTDYAKKKHNQKFKYLDLPNLLPDSLKPQSIRDFEAKTKTDVNRAISNVTKQLNSGGSTDKPKHWYPTRDAEGLKIGDEMFFGKMQWRCRDVLGGYAETEKERDFWRTSYDTTYDLLNRYSHPVLGYDDNLRPETERLFDLYLVLFGFVPLLDMFIIPGLIRDLEIRLEESQEMLRTHAEMKRLNKEIYNLYGIVSLSMFLRTD